MEEYKVKNYTLNEINMKFIESFFQFLRMKKNTCHNTSLKYIQLVKASLRPAIKAGVIKGDPFAELKLKPKPIHRNFLSQEEIDKIVSTGVEDPNLSFKKDIFLFACYTGLNYTDLTRLGKENIFMDFVQKIWMMTTNKPLHG